MTGVLSLADSAAAAAGAVIRVHLVVGHAAVGFLHEVLELVLEAQIGGGAVSAGHALTVGVAAAVVLAVGILPGSAARARSGGLGSLSLLDGEVDLPVIGYADDLDFDGLSILHVIVHIVHKGIRDLGNVDEPAFTFRQRHEGTEFGDAGDFAF